MSLSLLPLTLSPLSALIGSSSSWQLSSPRLPFEGSSVSLHLLLHKLFVFVASSFSFPLRRNPKGSLDSPRTGAEIESSGGKVCAEFRGWPGLPATRQPPSSSGEQGTDLSVNEFHSFQPRSFHGWLRSLYDDTGHETRRVGRSTTSEATGKERHGDPREIRNDFSKQIRMNHGSGSCMQIRSTNLEYRKKPNWIIDEVEDIDGI